MTRGLLVIKSGTVPSHKGEAIIGTGTQYKIESESCTITPTWGGLLAGGGNCPSKWDPGKRVKDRGNS